MKRLAILLLALPMAANAVPVTLDFTGLTDDTGANNEAGIAAALANAAAAGLTLTTDGLAFNVGCGTGNSCLGADAVAVNDFDGTIFGVFAGTTSVLDILFVNDLPPPTVTRLYDAADNLIATLNDNINYSGAAIARFEIDLDFDAFRTITFDLVAAPEPGTLALFGIGLLGIGLARRRRSR